MKTIVIGVAFVAVLVVLQDSGALWDVMWGTTGNDKIEGTGGPEVIFGRDGNDVIVGLGKWDTIFGGGGADLLYGGPGVDVILGGPGDDNLHIWNDEQRDVVFCGSGNDTVYMSGSDHALGSLDKRNCEVVKDVPYDAKTRGAS